METTRPSDIVQKPHTIVLKTNNSNKQFAANLKPNVKGQSAVNANIINTKPSVISINKKQLPKSGDGTRIVTIKGNVDIAVKNVNADSTASTTNSFLQNRTVLAKDQTLLSTPVVVVKNLSATTTEPKIRRLCQGIGEVQVRLR